MTAAAAQDISSLSRGPYRLEVTCPIEFLGPLHTGTGERLSVTTDAPVLRLPSGEPILTGASIRGVFRDWCEREAPLLGVTGLTLDSLFGITPQKKQGSTTANDRQGRLTVWNTRLPLATPSEIRDHVKIDRAHGAAARGAKFDQEVVLCRHTDITFVYEGYADSREEIRLLHCIVDALRDGLLSFGGKTGWGYGWARLREEPKISVLDRSSAGGLESYLSARLGGLRHVAAMRVLPGFGTLPTPQASAVQRNAWSWLRLDLELQFDGPMLIAGPDRRPLQQDEDATAQPRSRNPDAYYFTEITADEEPVLPGSSFRGVLRSHGERIAKTLGGKLEQIAERLFGFANDTADTGRQGLLRVGDGRLMGALHTVWMDHVAIDRITGFAADRKLFNTLALASPRFKLPLLVRWHHDERDERAATALLLFVLRDAAQKLLWVGSRTTRGYGHLAAVHLAAGRYSVARANGRAVHELDGSVKKIGQLGKEAMVQDLVAAWNEMFPVTKGKES